MAARYVRIGQHPDYRDEIRGTLSEILASTANPGTYAAPEDVTGTYLEMGSDGLWTGASVGTLTKAQADAVLAAQGVKATLKVGVPAQVDGGPVTWRGAVAGWTGTIPDNVGGVTTFVNLGDSIDSSYSTYAPLALMDLGLVGLNMGGVPGDTTAQMLARLDSAVIAYRPTLCHYKGGTNDIGASVATSVTLANIYEAYARCSAAGIKFIMSNIPPNNANIANTMKLRDAQFNFAAKYGIQCFDPFASFFNPSTGAWTAGANSDDKHPTSKTQIAASIALKAKLTPVFSQIPRFSRPIANIAGNGVFANPLMLTDSDANGVADGWSQTFGTPSLVTDSSFLGNVQNFATGGVSGLASFSQNVSVSAGDKILYTGKMRKVEDDGIRFLVYVPSASASGNYTVVDMYSNYTGTFSVILTMTAPRTSLYFSLFCQSGASPNVGLGELQAYNLTAMGLA